MLIIGICGASGSGKSTMAQALHQSLNHNSIMITQDCYYRDNSHLPFEERELLNYDTPEAFDHPLLLEDFKTLASGQPITKKGYDYALHCRSDSDELIYPAEALIFEGIHAFYDPKLRDLMDFKIYLQVDSDVCLLRRVKRDILKRGREIEGIYRQYLDTVKPMYEQYIKKYSEHADVIVEGGGKDKRIIPILAHYINSGMIEDGEEHPS